MEFTFFPIWNPANKKSFNSILKNAPRIDLEDSNSCPPPKKKVFTFYFRLLSVQKQRKKNSYWKNQQFLSKGY